jgi:secreted trypsin-like serine protease
MKILKLSSSVLLVVFAPLRICQGQGSTRIVGGNPVGNDRFPYFALLEGEYVKNGKAFVQTCGGTLITPQIVLVRTICHRVFQCGI